MNLQLGHPLTTLRPQYHNGPGWRIILYVQGCVHRCTDHCLSPHLLDPAAGREFSVTDVLQAVRQAADHAFRDIEGITVLGGEPFEQAAALAEVIRPLRNDGWTSMVYSGHTLESLQRGNDDSGALLAETDILVDGPYLPRLYNDHIAWRGSTNQRLLCLSNRYSRDELQQSWERQKKGYSIRIGPGGVSVRGAQDRTAAAGVEKRVAAWNKMGDAQHEE